MTVGPFALCVVVLAIYNAARFGGFGDFGTQYQLAGLDVQHLATEQLSYVPPGMFSYCSSPAQISLQFPHVFLQTTAQYPFPLPRDYEGTRGMLGPEIAGGMLPTMPITILLLSLPVTWLRRRTQDRAALLVVSIGVALDSGRYLPARLCPIRHNAALRGRLRVAGAGFGVPVVGGDARAFAPTQLGEAAVACLGVVLSVIGMAIGVAVSFTGYVNLLLLTHLRSTTGFGASRRRSSLPPPS